MAAKKKITAIVRRRKTQPASESRSSLPPGYAELLADIKNRIQATKVRAAVGANRELICLYWNIGHEISQRQKSEGWGTKGDRPIGRRHSEGVTRHRGLFRAKH